MWAVRLPVHFSAGCKWQLLVPLEMVRHHLPELRSAVLTPPGDKSVGWGAPDSIPGRSCQSRSALRGHASLGRRAAAHAFQDRSSTTPLKQGKLALEASTRRAKKRRDDRHTTDKSQQKRERGKHFRLMGRKAQRFHCARAEPAENPPNSQRPGELQGTRV